jgi:hypothetical protein
MPCWNCHPADKDGYKLNRFADSLFAMWSALCVALGDAGDQRRI